MENLGLENIRKISLCRQTTIADLLKSLSGEVMSNADECLFLKKVAVHQMVTKASYRMVDL